MAQITRTFNCSNSWWANFNRHKYESVAQNSNGKMLDWRTHSWMHRQMQRWQH